MAYQTQTILDFYFFKLLKNIKSDIQHSSLQREECHRALDPCIPAPFEGVHHVIKLSETPDIISLINGCSLIVEAMKTGLSSFAKATFKTKFCSKYSPGLNATIAFTLALSFAIFRANDAE